VIERMAKLKAADPLDRHFPMLAVRHTPFVAPEHSFEEIMKSRPGSWVDKDRRPLRPNSNIAIARLRSKAVANDFVDDDVARQLAAICLLSPEYERYDNALLLGYVFARRDRFLARLMLFGVAVGFAELAADAWLVDFTHTLDYSPGGGPMLWRSPLWMPFAWEVVAVQLSYLGLRLCQRYGGVGLLLVGILGGVNIPYYEEMAKRIHWWSYSGCRPLSHTPWYKI
jgi:hypothetical protein